jgi:DNA polymerase III subunit beta
MKIKLNLKSLQKSLKSISKAIPSNPQLPILSSILFEFKKNKLILSATDLYLGIRTTIDIENSKEKSIAVPGQMFKDIINSLSSKEITLEIKEKEVIVVAGSSRVKLPINDPSDYPDFPAIEGEEISLSSEIIQEINSLVSFAASRDQVRPILTTIMFDFSKKGLEVVATDGFRLAVNKYPQLKLDFKQKILMPIKAFEEICRIVDQVEANEIKIQVSQELKQIKVGIGENEMFVRLVEGDYPPYEKIIPENFKLELEVSGEEIEQEFHKAAIIAREASNIVKIKPEKESLLIKSVTTSYGEYSGETALMKSSASAEDMEVAFDIRYLMDFFSSVKPSTIKISINESLKPVAFRLPELDEFIYVVMPFRVND